MVSKPAPTSILIGGRLGFGLPILAWTVRNIVSLGSAVIISTSSGVNLLLGNNSNATPSSGVRADISTYTEHAGALGMNEIARNEFTQGAHWSGFEIIR